MGRRADQRRRCLRQQRSQSKSNQWSMSPPSSLLRCHLPFPTTYCCGIKAVREERCSLLLGDCVDKWLELCFHKGLYTEVLLSHIECPEGEEEEISRNLQSSTFSQFLSCVFPLQLSLSLHMSSSTYLLLLFSCHFVHSVEDSLSGAPSVSGCCAPDVSFSFSELRWAACQWITQRWWIEEKSAFGWAELQDAWCWGDGRTGRKEKKKKRMKRSHKQECDESVIRARYLPLQTCHLTSLLLGAAAISPPPFSLSSPSSLYNGLSLLHHVFSSSRGPNSCSYVLISDPNYTCAS